MIENTLIGYGIDNITAKRISKNHTLAQLRNSKADYLIGLGITEPVAERILSSKRTPVPSKTVNKILRLSAFICCICKDHAAPVVIHHIEPWENSHSHDLENLAVLCLNHHGEAHTQHQLSRNLTAGIIKKAQEEWINEVKNHGIEEYNFALENIQRYQGRWDFFNLNYIYNLTADNNISLQNRYTQTLQGKKLIDESGFINSEMLNLESSYWLDFFAGVYIRGYIESLVNRIINTLDIKYINNSLNNNFNLTTGDVFLLDGDFYFELLNKKTKGMGQDRKASCTINNHRFEGMFDAWYCNSSSSYSSHLIGPDIKTATQLGVVRNIYKDGDTTVITCTIIGLGLNLTKPDLMAQLMSASNKNVRTLPAGNEPLDKIADVKYGLEINNYYIFPPEKCDICSATLESKKYMIDGKTKYDGWANMCNQCYYVHGEKIGWGYGQLYLNQGNEKWLLVAGFDDSDDDEAAEELFNFIVGNK